MNKLGKCPDCPPGTRDALLINGRCGYHFKNPVKGKKKVEEVVKKAEATVPKHGVFADSQKVLGGLKRGKTVKKSSKPRKPVKKVSAKLKKELRAYSVERKKFLAEKKACEAILPGCTIIPTQVHHMEGRGVKLMKKESWLAICDSCHKKITEHSADAIERGLSKRRNGPTNPSKDESGQSEEVV